jgi:hypothetical protein
MAKQKILSEEDAKIRRQITDLIKELFRYKTGEFNTANIKYIDKLIKIYPYTSVYETFIQCKSKIIWALENKQFKDDIGRIAYVFAIIENQIFDVHKKAQERPKQHTKEHEIDVDFMNSVQQTPNKKKDLSQYFDEV